MDKEQGRKADGAPERAHNAGAGAPSCSNTIRTARSRTSGAYFADLCFAIVNAERGIPKTAGRIILKCFVCL